MHLDILCSNETRKKVCEQKITQSQITGQPAAL